MKHNSTKLQKTYPKNNLMHLKRVMKIAFFLIFAVIFQLAASNAEAQKAIIYIEKSVLTLHELIDEIENQTDYLFVYKDSEIDLSEQVKVNARHKPVDKVLNQAFTNSSLTYELANSYISLRSANKKEEKTISEQTKKKITGTVVDENGTPVIGANVVEKGTTNGIITNIDGQFALEVADNATLQISYIGYTTREVQVKDQKNLTVILVEDTQTLEEVVVTAFGTGQKKESIVGSIQSVSPDDLIIPATNLSNAFAGRLSGVIAYQRSGEPGADGSTFYIRGISTLSGAKNPLIVIDGVEASNASLNALPPEVIESFSILKDATATAMYGTRGANGVLIVKTKSGANLDKPAINIRVENAINSPTSIPKFVSGAEYMSLYNEAVRNESLGDGLYTNEEIEGTKLGLNPYIFPNVNWYDEIFKSHSMSQNVNFNVRGGGKKLDYFVNIGYNHQEGMLRARSREFYSYDNNINLNRYVFQNNFNLNLTDISKISLRLNTQLQTKRSPNWDTGSMFGAVINTSPTEFPVMYPKDESYDWVRWGGMAEGNTETNPLAELTRGYKDSFTSKVTANLEFDQKLDMITEGLSFKALASFRNETSSGTHRIQGYNMYRTVDYTKEENGDYTFTIEPIGEENEPVLSTVGVFSGSRRIYLQAYLDYTRRFGLHDVSAMLLYNQDEVSNNKIENLMSSLPHRKQGVAARATYGYDNRYLFEANLGYNGSENFAKNHRWGFFPSVAVGYNISREKFFEPLINTISNLKIRVSYGLVGNDQIGSDRFVYLSDIDLGGSDSYKTGYDATTTSLSGPKYIRYGNNQITWEVGKKLNAGVDLQLFGDLNIVVDFFREDRENIFQQKTTIPNYLGTSDTKVFGNFAKVRNQGFDLAVDYGKIINEDWTIQFKGTFTFARNEITAYDEPTYMEYPWLRKVGGSLNRLEGYLSDHLFIDWNHIANSPDQQISGNVAPGDIKYLDQPNIDGEYNGIINSDDRVPMGYPTVPQIIYGFGPSVKYKNIDFSCLFQGVARSSLMMSGFHPFGTQNSRNVLQFIADDYWSPDNQNIYAAYPRLTKIGHGNNTANSDFWLRDASFLKLKNAEIGYTYNKMRIYVSGMNLLTFSSFKHWDPEQGGGSGLKYPTQRSFNIGLQLNL